MSALFDGQILFTADVVRLLREADQLNYQITLGECARSIDQQRIYVQQGRSRTLRSQHLVRLAIDLNIFIAGATCTREQIEPLGTYWEALHPNNRWGGSWRGLIQSGRSIFVDAPHFERMLK